MKKNQMGDLVNEEVPTYGINTNKCCERCIEGLDKCIHWCCENVNTKCYCNE